MKKELWCLVLIPLLTFSAGAQVTRLSNNTSYDWGFPLSNSKILLRSKISKTVWAYDIPGNSFTQLSSAATVESDYQYGILNGKLYFAGKTVAEGIELWVTDGTPGGTSLLKDINGPGAADSDPRYGFVVYNNELYFTANDGTSGRELWKTNGTGAGTIRVKDINTGAPDAFTASSASNFKVINGVLVFSAITAADGGELWKTDGTDAGTVQLKNIYATATYGSYISNFTEYGTDLLFTAFDATNGQGLWKTDGSTAGTLLIKDIDAVSPVFGPPFPYNIFTSIFPGFFSFQNQLYFSASDGVNGFELWKTDGTTAGTTLVKDINTGSDDGFPQVFLAVKNNNKFFFSATTAAAGTELWQSDGTGAGTTLLADIESGPTSSDVTILPDFFGSGLFQGNKFFFIANTPGVEGNEFYVSDGTPGGTVLLRDINPGPANGYDGTNLSWFYTSNKFLFVADDGINGAELWQTDGTVSGTALLADVNTNAGASSAISSMIAVSNTLFFFGTDGDDPVNTDYFKLDGALTLPLRWVSFEARPSNNDVLLLWETAIEEQTDYFIVQRSSDGDHYSEIGRVRANGTGSAKYSFTDMGALKHTAVKKWFYRIKDVDKDGKSALSRVATVALNKQIASILISPNPVANELRLVVESAGNASASINVINMNGKIILQKSINLHRGANTITENVSRLSNGMYTVQIITDGPASADRFLISR